VKIVVEEDDTKEEKEYPVSQLKFRPKRKNVKVTKEEMKKLAELEDKG
jgi:hypothetical protein